MHIDWCCCHRLLLVLFWIYDNFSQIHYALCSLICLGGLSYSFLSSSSEEQHDDEESLPSGCVWGFSNLQHTIESQLANIYMLTFRFLLIHMLIVNHFFIPLHILSWFHFKQNHLRFTFWFQLSISCSLCSFHYFLIRIYYILFILLMLKLKHHTSSSSKYYSRIIRSYQSNVKNLSDKHKNLLDADAV